VDAAKGDGLDAAKGDGLDVAKGEDAAKGDGFTDGRDTGGGESDSSSFLDSSFLDGRHRCMQTFGAGIDTNQ
jgi:hypothetical protein